MVFRFRAFSRLFVANISGPHSRLFRLFRGPSPSVSQRTLVIVPSRLVQHLKRILCLERQPPSRADWGSLRMKRISLTFLILAAAFVAFTVALWPRRPKLIMNPIGLTNHSSSFWFRLAVTNVSNGSVSALVGTQVIEGSQTNFLRSRYNLGELNGLAPGCGVVMEIPIPDTDDLWRPVVQSCAPYQEKGLVEATRWRIAGLLEKHPWDHKYIFAAAWRRGTNSVSDSP